MPEKQISQPFRNPPGARANPLTPIESSLAQIGCIKNEDGTLAASVMACKTVDENTRQEDIVIKAFYTTGEIVSPYTGEWSECSAPAPLINLGNFCY